MDNVLDDTACKVQSTLNTMRGTPNRLESHCSDGDSTVSYLSTTAFGAADPEDLRDATSQTPGHAGTQTQPDFFKIKKAKAMQTQTGSYASLHSVGNQTRRSSGLRADIMKNILLEVKVLKQQRGLDNSSDNDTDDEVNSVESDNTIKKETLQHVLHDVRELREADATGTMATQTVNEEGVQTSLKLFPEGDPVRKARLEKFKSLMDEMKEMKGSETGTPGSQSRASVSTRSETPVNRYRAHTPTRLSSFGEVPIHQNGYTPYPIQNMNAAAPAFMMAPSQPMPQPVFQPGRRMVTQEDLNNISQRLERLLSYMPQRRPTPPPPPPPPQYIVPVYVALPPPPRKSRLEDTYLLDENEYDDLATPRRQRAHLYLESALEEASMSALQLKHLSENMKDSLMDNLHFDFM